MSLSLYLCLMSFALCYLVGRRSLVGGLVAVLAVGYVYGITRANVPETYSHFIFDASVLGLYCAQLFRRLSPAEQFKIQAIKPWFELLIAWPFLMFLIPIQDTWIQVVGLRGNIFLLPMLLIGARMEPEERYRLALWLAGLNLVAFAFACAEFFWGLPFFFPRNELTKLIYTSNTILNQTAFRIPSTFANAHSYAGAMVMTIPFLAGALMQKKKSTLHVTLFVAALATSLLGVFMSATRLNLVVASLLVVVALFSIGTRFAHTLGWVIIILGIGWLVSADARLQRFTELQDTSMVAERIAGSVNMNFFELARQYPFGNGLGGGGTSIPYFLRDRIINPIYMENEYARIMLEQGIVGLILWLTFIIWLLTRRVTYSFDNWKLGRRLAWCACAAFFGVGLIGTGLLTAVPMSCLLLLCAGWVGAGQPGTSPQPVHSPRRVETTKQIYGAQYN